MSRWSERDWRIRLSPQPKQESHKCQNRDENTEIGPQETRFAEMASNTTENEAFIAAVTTQEFYFKVHYELNFLDEIDTVAKIGV
jgi:hypothetical protein